MMKLAPSALTAVRKEFFAREDDISLEEFIYIIQKHLLNESASSGTKGEAAMTAQERREFAGNMYELFKDVDVNGDGGMEWEELTKFIVEKANQLNKKIKLTSLSTYYDNSSVLDPAALTRHRNEYSALKPIPCLLNFAAIEDHRNAIFIYNSRNGALVTTLTTDATPLAIENIENVENTHEKNMLVCATTDMLLTFYTTDDPVPAKRYQRITQTPTIGTQMSLAYMPANEHLYTGGSNGNIYAYRIREKTLAATLKCHSDIVMKLLPLSAINNLIAASLDTSISVWDTYTHTELLTLRGHNKGVFSLSYNPDFRLLVSSGFDHDALVWSPFVKSLVYRLKGHNASLIGCQCIEDTPEIVTADIDGVFKLWDIRNFQCVQTFTPNDYISKGKGGAKLNAFFHTRLPSTSPLQKEDDARIYACTKKLIAFDQLRVVSEATTDFRTVLWIEWNGETSVFLTASEKNLIIWDALQGSYTVR
jgi:hypothetical protein